MKRVAVVDTGLDLTDKRFTPVLCKEGHRDFTGEGLIDREGHGTAVAGLIKDHAKDSKYCLIILKYATKGQTLFSRVKAYQRALIYLHEIKPDYVNLSLNGSDEFKVETMTVASLKGTKFIAAAGNDGLTLSGDQTSYPAQLSNVYGNVIAVAAGNPKTGVLSEYSNRGLTMMRIEEGGNILVDIPCSIRASCKELRFGTSMAAAIATGKIVKEDETKWNIGRKK